MNKKPGNQTFRLGDTVRIVSGPFVSFTGKIEGINQSKALLQVKVAIYGRNTPIRLNFAVFLDGIGILKVNENGKIQSDRNFFDLAYFQSQLMQ